MIEQPRANLTRRERDRMWIIRGKELIKKTKRIDHDEQSSKKKTSPKQKVEGEAGKEEGPGRTNGKRLSISGTEERKHARGARITIKKH